ncbi:MAG: DNA polymerase (family X) [Microgenomates group bacterium Gr01-1014_16]|nr:MAG: DNA polymerase (family X) [Microgenomates group bacterium Gr01-1014_16]
MTNLEIAKLLRSVAAALELSSGDNRFRIIAYDRAADAIEHASSEAKDLWDDGELKNLPGVGEAISSHLDELFRTGKVRHFTSIFKFFPPALFELLEVPGIGPKNAYKLCNALGITSGHSAISKLKKAATNGQIAKIEGFGEDSQAKILLGITEFQGRSKRQLLPAAQMISDSIIDWLKKLPQVKQINTLGSLRRQASTVGDIDISVASDHAKIVIDHFTTYPKKRRVLEAGEHTASLILPNDIQVDLMVQPPESYGSLLQHFTGSKHHNILLREYALKKGLSLSEYGITPRPPLKLRGGGRSPRVICFDSEEKFYNFLGLDWLPPELREGKDEIKFAQLHQLPKLVELSDIKGDLQIHSSIDVEPSHDLGTSSLSELSTKCIELGYEYFGLTEHNPSFSRHTVKQVEELIKKKTEIIRNFQSKIHIFNGLEIDIQPDGRRALPDSCLDMLDYACVSIHSSFRLNRKAMTDRVLAALDHPKVKFFAHPTGRLLNEREGVELDWDRIFDFCLKNNKWLEIDAWPNRLDLPDVIAHEAVKAGVKIVIDTDSHDAAHLEYMRYGVSVARRAWCTKSDILNTLPLLEMKKLLLGGE